MFALRFEPLEALPAHVFGIAAVGQAEAADPTEFVIPSVALAAAD